MVQVDNQLGADVVACLAESLQDALDANTRPMENIQVLAERRVRRRECQSYATPPRGPVAGRGMTRWAKGRSLGCMGFSLYQARVAATALSASRLLSVTAAQSAWTYSGTTPDGHHSPSIPTSGEERPRRSQNGRA